MAIFLEISGPKKAGRSGLWDGDGVIGLDTGCLWGRHLTAVRLDSATPQFTSIPCRAYRK